MAYHSIIWKRRPFNLGFKILFVLLFNEVACFLLLMFQFLYGISSKNIIVHSWPKDQQLEIWINGIMAPNVLIWLTFSSSSFIGLDSLLCDTNWILLLKRMWCLNILWPLPITALSITELDKMYCIECWILKIFTFYTFTLSIRFVLFM